MAGNNVLLGDGIQTPHQPKQTNPFTTGDVEKPTRHCGFRGFGHSDIGLHHIGDMDEIPGLEAVAENHGCFPAQGLRAKASDDTGIGRVVGLPWPEDIEVAQRYGRQSVELMEHPAVRLRRVFLQGVGRERLGRQAFVFGRGFIVAVDGRRRREHPSAYSCSSGCFQQLDRRGEIGVI